MLLSIGYSTCHWCHVMEKESFEDDETAKVLNEQFVCIKVDKEERPDIDSVYMKYCQAFTGSGGWPMTAFLFPDDKKPFFAGTYFPKHTRGRHVGLIELTQVVKDKWRSERKSLIQSADTITEILKKSEKQKPAFGTPDMKLVDRAFWHFSDTFDNEHGGFGSAPKFPSPHNLLFLLNYHQVNCSFHALEMAEKTLTQMYRGGIFDHVGCGFSRYSTDSLWLAPHFEKMLYDNALLILAYARAYEITGNKFYRKVVEKTIAYILREMTDVEGGFYSAQDADADGEEGKFYLFDHDEIFSVLGDREGEKVTRFYNVTKKGNFEGKNILNLINNPLFETEDLQMEKQMEKLCIYRKNRYKLHKDDKILLSWNCLMIAALAEAARIFKDKTYLTAAEKANEFLLSKMTKDGKLFVSYRNGNAMQEGFLDDYAFFIFAQLNLYDATLEKKYLFTALEVLKETNARFLDSSGGYYLYGKDSESLVLMPKDTYDGAIPSGNSVMAYNLLKLSRLTEESFVEEASERQINFMFSASKEFAGGYTFFMSTLLMYLSEPKKIVCVLKDPKDREELLSVNNFNTTIALLKEETKDYPLKDGKTTYYVCKDNSCLPPTNSLSGL